jgi:hypothetical protein
LPRFAAKVRASLSHELPWSYRLALGSPRGIDGSFLRQFQLSYRQFVQAIEASSSDETLAQWFRALPSVTDDSIASWNRHAPMLGSKGCPGYLIRHLVKWVYYPKSLIHPVQSLFEAIEQDERT